MDVRRPWSSNSGAPIARITTILDQSEARARPPREGLKPGPEPAVGESGLDFPFGWRFDKRDLPRSYRCLGGRPKPPGPETARVPPPGGPAGGTWWEPSDPVRDPPATGTGSADWMPTTRPSTGS